MSGIIAVSFSNVKTLAAHSLPHPLNGSTHLLPKSGDEKDLEIAPATYSKQQLQSFDSDIANNTHPRSSSQIAREYACFQTNTARSGP